MPRPKVQHLDSDFVEVKKCVGCKKRTTYKMISDDGDHHWERMNCGYIVPHLLDVKLIGE